MSYNGWSNYETWVVKLWMDNEEESYNFWQERIEELCSSCDDRDEGWDSDAVHTLADELKDTHEEALPAVEGFAADLLNAAMSEVDWREIAQSMVDDWAGENPLEAEEADDPQPAPDAIDIPVCAEEEE